VKGHLSPKEILMKKDKEVESNPENAWTEA